MPTTRWLSRRELMRASAGSLLLAGLWPGTLDAADAPADGPFHFVVLNDLHFLDKRCGPWHEGVVRQIKAHQQKVEFCLVVGDLVENGKADQLDAVRQIYQRLEVPMHTVIGNHDWQTDKDRKNYDELFPKATNYSFAHRGWQYVGLDSTNGTKYEKVAVPPETLQWLDGALGKFDKKRPLVLFTHFPLGPMVTYRATNADALLERFKDYALRAVFNGHFHASTERTVGGTAVTTNRCCAFSRNNHDGSKEKGYFLCQAKDGQITRQFIEFKLG